MTTNDDDQLIAFGDERAAQLVGVSLQTLRRWERLDFVRPSVVRRISERNTVRLYGFHDLEALLVVVTLRDQGRFSTQHIRQVVGRLQQSYTQPLSELRFALDAAGDQIFFQHPDGTWEGSRKPNQVLLKQVLELDEIRAQIRRVARGDRGEEAGKITRQRKVLGRRAVFAGTRVPVDTVVEYLEDGCDDATILEAFPRLTAADLDAAREHVAAS